MLDAKRQSIVQDMDNETLENCSDLSSNSSSSSSSDSEEEKAEIEAMKKKWKLI